MKQQDPKRQHYFSLAVEMTIVEPAEDNKVAISAVKANVLLHKAEACITLKDIARVQQQAQLNFFSKIQDPTNMTVQDVVILGVNHLGFMTAEEWHDGMQVPESQAKPGLQLVKTDDVMPAPDQVQ